MSDLLNSKSGFDRFDIFLFSLIQNSKLPISSASFFLELDSEFRVHRNTLHQLIKNNFQNARIEDKRLEYYVDWIAAINDNSAVDSDLILLITYDDHAYIDSNEAEFQTLALNTLLYQTEQAAPVYGCLSHFPECISSIPIYKSAKMLKHFREHLIVPARKPIGAVLLTPATLQRWFANDLWLNNRIVAPENYFGPSIVTNDGLGLIPRRELFRHLDGYSHVGLEGFGHVSKSHSTSKSLRDEKKSEFSFLIDTFQGRIEKSNRIQPKFISNDNQLEIFLKTNSRRLSRGSTSYVLGETDWMSMLSITLKAIKSSSIFRKNILYYPVDLLAYLVMSITVTIKRNKVLSDKRVMDFLELWISFRLMRAIGIMTQIRGKISSLKSSLLFPK